MAFTRNWSESTPLGSENANLADDYIRYSKVDISDRLKNMIYGFVSGENTLSQHFQYIQFYEQSSVSQPSAGYGRLYCKAVSGKCEVFWQDEDGNEIQLTSGGKFVGGYGTTSQMIMWNTTEEDTENGRESQIRAKGEQSGGEVTTLGYLEFSHDGTSDDQKGRCRIVLNDGDDSDTPSKVAIVFQSDGAIDVGDSVSVLDEDNMASDSATKLATQQSIKAYSDLMILGDGTTGRVARYSQLTIEDGTNASTLKCTLASVWNGDAIAATDNIAKNATTGNYTLSATGVELIIEAAGLSGNVVMAMGSLKSNASGTALTLDVDPSSNDVSIILRSATAASGQDMTSLVDTGNIIINILYICSA